MSSRLIVNAAAWDTLLSHYTERIGRAAAEKFMEQHFEKSERAPAIPLTSL